MVLPIVLLSAGCKQEVPIEEPVRPVKALKVADAATFENIRYNGVAEAVREGDLSFRVGGPMITRAVKVGDEVKKGQILARIDPRDFEVRLRTVKGQLTKAKAVLKRAEADLERVLRIQKQDPGAVSQSMIDKAQQTKDSTKAEINSLAAAVDQARDQLNYTYLKAPFDGIITKTYMEAFEDVRPKQPVVRLLDESKRSRCGSMSLKISFLSHPLWTRSGYALMPWA